MTIIIINDVSVSNRVYRVSSTMESRIVAPLYVTMYTAAISYVYNVCTVSP
jgi:hypothetical protein